MIGERVPNVGERVRFFLKGHLGFEVCVSSFPAHISGFPVLLLVLLFFADRLPIRQRCSSPALDSHRLRNLKTGEYGMCSSNVLLSFLFLFCFFRFFWAANSSSSSSSYCTSFRFPFWVLCCFLSFFRP